MSAAKLELAPKITPVDWALVESCAQHLEVLQSGSATAQEDSATHLLTTVYDPFSSWIAPDSATTEQLLALFRLSQALAELNAKDAKDADNEIEARDEAIKKMKSEERTLRLQIKELNEENEDMAQELKKGGSSTGVSKSERLQFEQEIEQLRRKLTVAVELSEKERSTADAVRVELDKCMRDLQASEAALDKFKRDAEQNRMRLEMEREDAQTKEDRAREQQMKLRQQSKDTLRNVKELEALSKKHQELLDEKVKVDAQLIEYSREVVNLNQDLEVARVSLLEAEQQLVTRTREVETLRVRSKDVTVQMSRRDEEDQRRLQEMNQQILSVKQIVEQERQQNKEMKLAITRLRGENERLKLESSADHMRQKVQELERNLDQLQSKLQNSQAECLASHLAGDQLKKSLDEANRKLDDSALLMQQKIAEREEKLKKESQKKDDALIESRRRADDLTRNIADLEEELSSVNGRMAQYESGSYMLADAVREVKDLKIRVRSTEDKLVVRTQQVNRLEETVEALHDELELMRAKFGIPAESKLDLSGLKVKRALELERLKSVNTQLERDIEQLENERYELHQELRHAAMRRADIAMQVGLSAEDLQKLESFSDYLKSGGRAGAPAEMSESGDPTTVQRKVKALTNRLEESKREASEQRALAEECAQQNEALKKEVELLTKDKEVKERAFFKEISDKIDSMFSNQRLVGNVSVIPTTPARQSASTASSQQNIVHVHSGQALTADVIQDIVAQAVRQFSGSLPSFTAAAAHSDTSALSIEAVRKQLMDASREAAYYKEQFNHATEELKDAEAQRDQFKQDLARTRSFAQIARNGEGDNEAAAGSSGGADCVELHNVSAFTIEVLETLEARERELRETKGELEMYARDFGIIWQQQCLLYQEHAASVKAMKQQLDASKAACHRAEAEAAMLAKKCASQDELLDQQKSSAPPSQDFVDLRRKLIFTEAEKDSLERRLQVANDALEEANASNDAFRSDLLQSEIAFKKHQGAQQRRLQAMTAHVTRCDALIRDSQPRAKYLELERNYHEVLSRCARDSEREMEVLHDRSELHDLRKEADRLRTALSDAETQLSTERLKASSAMERLQQLSLSHGPSAKDQIAALMHKIVMFEVSERNALSKAAIAKQRQSEAESSLQMSESRIENLELELRNAVEDRHRLQSQVRNYQMQNAESLSKEEATKMRSELEELRARSQKLDEEVTKQREGSELAQQQCKALLRVREVQKSELSELRLLVQQLQGKNDEYLEYGEKEITLSRARRRIADLEHALDNSINEKNRLEVVLLRLEEALDSRFEELMAAREEARVRISCLEMAIADGAAVQHGSVSLDKVEKLRASLRQLTDQQRVSSEIASQARKKCVDLEGQLEDLQAESRAQKDMIERMRGGGARGENDFLEMSKKLSDLRVQELRLKRQIRQLQDRESYLSQINESLEATVCELETKVVEQQHMEEKSMIDAKLKLERLEQSLVEAHARERSTAANAAAMAARSAMHGSDFSDANSTRSRPLPGTYHPESSESHHSAILSSDVRELQAQVLGLQNELDIARHELADVSASARSGDADSNSDVPQRNRASDANTEHLEAMLDQAKITIENKQKVIASKNEMIQKYQKMLVEVRLEFLESKDEDAREIAHCKEELLHLRTRSSAAIDTSGPIDAAEVHRMREEIDTFVRRVQELEKEKQAWVAERDSQRAQRRSSVVSGGDGHRSSSGGASAPAAAPVSHAPLSQDVEALQGEIRRLRRDLAARTHELDAKTTAIKEIRNEISSIDGPGKAKHEAELRSFRESMSAARVALSGLKASLAELTSAGAAPAAVTKIETGVRTAIESLGHVSAPDASHTLSSGEAKAMTDASDKLQQRLTQLQLRLSKMKEEVDDTNSRCAAAESKASAKEKEAAENSERLKRLSADMRKAEASVRDARDALEAKNAELEDAMSRVSALEHRLSLLSASKPAAAPSVRPSSAGPVGAAAPSTEVRGRSVEQWETEKRLQDRAAAMQKQITKLKDEAKAATKALEDARAAWEKDKEGLQNRIRILESRKPNAVASAADSEAPSSISRAAKGPSPDWNAVAEAERRASAAELARIQSDSDLAKARIELGRLQEVLKGTEQMCEEQGSRARSEGQRADEAQRMASASGLEREALLVAELRAVREELEEARNDAAVAHCESIEGRHAAQLSKYDAEHAHLTVTVLQARVRELERLPLGGDAGAVSALTSSIDLASRDRLGELERLVTSLRKLVDKLQSENASLRKAATTNVKYVELMRENKALKSKLAAWEDTTGDGPGAQLAKAKADVVASKEAARKAEAAVAAASKQLKREQDEVSSLHSRLKDAEKLVAELQRKSEASRRSTEATAGEREASANSRAAAAEKVSADLQSRVKDLEERLRSAVNEVEVKKAQCVELKGRLHEASKRVADAEQLASAGAGSGSRRVEDGDAGEDSEVAQLRRELRRAKRSIRDADDIKRRLQTLEQENVDLKAELDSLDPAFFEEVEDLKYQHRETQQLAGHYEEMLQLLSERYGFPFNPEGVRRSLTA